MTNAEMPTDPHRPLLHYTPPTGWLNDPNGLVYLDGEYHLFYQHHPDSTVWGPMHWGHAVSRDLLVWQDLPIALAPDPLGMIFSGSAVIDTQNTAGFGAGALVAVFTHSAEYYQTQSLAFSSDAGRSWAKYADNPVLTPPENTPDFRDPKVFWYGNEPGDHWVMLLAVNDSVWIYTSPDLKRWTKTDELRRWGAIAGVWECPELVELPIVGSAATAWVLVVSVQLGAPAGGSGVQYFVGGFDGARFTPAESAETVRWADFGADFYAPQIWNAAPDHRRIWLAWLNNWDYAKETPASHWRGSMSLPRELALSRDAAGLRLIQQPIAELAARRHELGSWQGLTLAPGENPLETLRGDALEIVVRAAVDPAGARRFGLRLRVGQQEQTTLTYDRDQQTLTLDRSHSGQLAPRFTGPQVLPLAPRDGAIDLRVIMDRSSVEVFADGGRGALTSQIFPDLASQGLALFAEGGSVQIVALAVYRLER